MYSLALIIFVVDEKKAFGSDMKFKMAATAGLWTLWEKCFKTFLL
jgi:hypothetical protein